MAGTRRKDGPLAPVADGYRVRLMTLGYTPGSTRFQLRMMGQFGRWMQAEGAPLTRLDEGLVRRFLVERRTRGQRPTLGMRSFTPLLEHLRAQGAIAPAAGPPQTPLEDLLQRYRGWLVRERGLAAATVHRYLTLGRRFLAGRALGGTGVEGLCGAEVSAFLLSECGRLSVGSAKGRVAELRALLHFLYVEGLTERALAAAVPPVAGWRDARLPTTISAAEVRRLLAGCERSHPMGRRDLAMLTLLARLGLRSIEIARLELDDLDWRAGELVVRGKARRRERLPLPRDVGVALVAYLRGGRPRADARQVFLTCRAPVRPIRPDLVSDVTRRACLRAGIAPVGAHRLRHALATEMLRQGASLVEISQVLRHRDLATTAIYAKVDLVALRQVAQPWPGATP
jgi:site-specific recombinase XerD